MTKEYDEVVDNMCNISGYYTQDYDEAIARLTKAESDLAKTTDRAKKAEGRADKAESELARYKALYGDIDDKV